MNKAYIALGTNIEPRYTYLKNALNMLAAGDHSTIKQKSSIYETAPVGYTDQADFLNMVIEVDTSLSSMELLEFCQSIEKELGRRREFRFGPRTIDLDILAYNDENIKTEQLIVPHPRMHERAFVLIPLVEIAPGLELPNWNKDAKTLLSNLPNGDIKDVAKWIANELAGE